ncbi:hypothetical protein HX045_10655 [Myroides odoratimimus]|uniref:Uncharacterized protein n=4 Tax=Myroides TaxID=76831 RepID=A0A0S7ECN4_9FLAO|nr:MULTISPECIES: hypothetical protein [Myroides]AJA69020.1 hypothetical protein MYRA21_1878 [Myroides sp. A21]AJH13872.1 hypothetical protein MPR_0672 [Myroides profundi]ALU26262.1 hypothetical protein AS202_08920 [Myroides odoratimimus]APA92314.1 hypothetical protein BK054_08785 [Myroides sp. ZB35]EHO12262.1 hypothetical protein HMPREF9712_00509 [Myroides odoratimimus CCUG 10230]
MNSLVKFSLFTVIYVMMTWFLTDEVGCAFSGDEQCLISFVVKYIIFIALMFVYDKWVKGRIFKTKNK